VGGLPLRFSNHSEAPRLLCAVWQSVRTFESVLGFLVVSGRLPRVVARTVLQVAFDQEARVELRESLLSLLVHRVYPLLRMQAENAGTSNPFGSSVPALRASSSQPCQSASVGAGFQPSR